MRHLEKESGKAKCGSRPWGHAAYLWRLTSNPDEVQCRRCKGTINRRYENEAIKEKMVGRIFHTSFGYDMTINVFAKVIKQTEKTITLQPIKTSVKDDDGRGNGRAKPYDEPDTTEKIFTLKKMKSKEGSYSYWSGGKYGPWSEWDGQEHYHNTWD